MYVKFSGRKRRHRHGARINNTEYERSLFERVSGERWPGTKDRQFKIPFIPAVYEMLPVDASPRKIGIFSLYARCNLVATRP